MGLNKETITSVEIGDVGGDFSDSIVAGRDVVVGNHIIQIGSVHGGIVNLATSEQKPEVKPRPAPVLQRPRPFPGLLDRKTDVRIATRAFQAGEPVEIQGETGIGKTVLLRYLAHEPATDIFRDGVVHRSARNQPLDDLLQLLFEDLYESVPPYKPTQAELRSALQSRQTLVLLDNMDLDRSELETLMDTASSSTFIWASRERYLWGEGRSVTLKGLPLEDAQALVERELGRPLTANERSQAQTLCAALKGHPLHILQAVALVHNEGESLATIAQRMQTAAPTQTLAEQLPDSLSEPERRIVAAIAVLKNVPLGVKHLAALTGQSDSDVTSSVETLLQRGIIAANSPRYTLTGSLPQTLQHHPALASWTERTLNYFTLWAEKHQQTPDLLVEEADAIWQLLSWAVESERWPEALRLGRAVEGGLALERRWGMWNQILQGVLMAAQMLDDKLSEAWTRHQLGSRALCLGDVEIARSYLTEALHMREALGDQAGAAVTRHNLNLLQPPLPPPNPPSEPPPKPAPVASASQHSKLMTVLSISILILGLFSAGLALASGQLDEIVGDTLIAFQDATPTPNSMLTPTGIPSPTDIPTSTPNPTPVPLPTVTPVSPTPTKSPTPVTPTPITPTPEPASVVIVRDINIRLLPGTGCAVVAFGAPGETYPLLGQNYNGTWLQIEFPGTADGTAWLYAPLVQVSGTLEQVERVQPAPCPPAEITTEEPLPLEEPEESITPGPPPTVFNEGGCEHLGSGARPIIEWTYDQPLAEDEFFVVTFTFWQPNLSEIGQDFFWVKVGRAEIPGHIYDQLPPAGDFKWSVSVVRQPGVDAKGNLTGLKLTAESEVVECFWYRDSSGGGSSEGDDSSSFDGRSCPGGFPSKNGRCNPPNQSPSPNPVR